MENEIIKELNDSFVEFKKANTSKLDEIKSSSQDQYNELYDRLLPIEQRGYSHPDPGVVGGGGPDYDKKSFTTYLKTGNPEHLTKSMSITTEASGGYTHIPQLGNSIVAAVGEINPLLTEVNLQTIGANQFDQLVTTTRSGSARSAESGNRNATGTATFAKVSIPLFDLYAYPSITNELRDSSQFNLDAWLRAEVRDAFNEALSVEFVTGDGSSKCTGLLDSMSANGLGESPDLPFGSLYYMSASPITITYARLLSLMSSLPVRYKAAGNVKWYVGTQALEAIRGLLDQNNLPIWRQDFGIAGAPMVLLGHQVVEVPQLDGTGYPVLFGDMRQTYTFVTHQRGLGMLTDMITSPGTTKYYASLQCGGAVVDSRAMVALVA